MRAGVRGTGARGAICDLCRCYARQRINNPFPQRSCILNNSWTSLLYINLIMPKHCQKIRKVVFFLPVEKIKCEDVSFDGYASTKVTEMGNVTEVLTMRFFPSGTPCKKVNKNYYVDTRTGEAFLYQHYENRSDGLESIRQTLCKIRALINSNCSEPNNVRWVTLTYRQDNGEPMTDTNRLYQDFKKFWQRFCYWCASNSIGKPEYISVQEPQGSGAWHVHAFFIWEEKAPFIPNRVLSDLWGFGFVKIKAMQNCDNAGAYFSAYLADMPLDDVNRLSKDDSLKALSAGLISEKAFEDDDGLQKTKKFVKGARLFMYPAGMNILRYSKGIKKPVVEYMTKKEAEKKVCPLKQTFSSAFKIVADNGQISNIISKTYYNSKR